MQIPVRLQAGQKYTTQLFARSAASRRDLAWIYLIGYVGQARLLLNDGGGSPLSPQDIFPLSTTASLIRENGDEPIKIQIEAKQEGFQGELCIDIIVYLPLDS